MGGKQNLNLLKKWSETLKICTFHCKEEKFRGFNGVSKRDGLYEIGVFGNVRMVGQKCQHLSIEWSKEVIRIPLKIDIKWLSRRKSQLLK